MSTALLSRQLAAAAVLAFATLGAASSAHARSDVSFSIGIQVPGVQVEAGPIYRYSQPVYVRPHPVYMQPRPVFMQPRPVFMQPRPVFMQPAPTYIYYGQQPGWQRGKWHQKHGHGNWGRFDDRGGRNDDRDGHRR